MTTTQNIAAALAARTALVAKAEATTGRRASNLAWDAVEQADNAVKYAVRAHEQAVRAANPQLSEAEIMALALAA